MWSLSEHIAYRVIEGEAFLLDVALRKVHKLNEVGTLVLQCVEQNMSEDEIVQKVLEKYEVSEETARKDICSFLDALLQKNLIRKSDRG